MRTVSALAIAAAFPLFAVACGLDDGTVSIVGDAPPGTTTDGGTKLADGGPILSDGAPVDDTGSPVTDSGSDPDTNPPEDPPFLWAVAPSGLYSIAVTTGAVKARGAFGAGCNAGVREIAVDPTDAILGIIQNGAELDFVDVSKTGDCTAPRKLDSSHTEAIAFQGDPNAKLYGVRDSSHEIESMDRTNGNDVTLSHNLPRNAESDLACDQTQCYVVYTNAACSPDPGPTMGCLFKVSLDGLTATQIGPFAAVNTAGVAYYGGKLFLFSSTSSLVTKLDPMTLGTSPFPLTGDPAPVAWSGAGSSSRF